MSLQLTAAAVVATPGQKISLASLLSSNTGSALPEYLVLTGLDRNEYTAASTGAKGSIAGNGAVASFVGAPGGSDEFNIGIVFTYSAGSYLNDSFGSLANLTFTASTDLYRSAYLALYGFGSAGQPNDAQSSMLKALANSATANPSLQFYIAPPAGGTALGSIDIITRSNASDSTPNAATPSEIAAVAAGFVGQIWNSNGCWVLASNIATAAGASLPVSSASPLSLAPQAANGEWVIAYDSSKATAAQQLTWQTQLKTGDIVAYDQYCGGHILTVASGDGYGAQIIDNDGVSAADGAANDIVIGSAHSLNDAFLNGHGLAQYVVIYRLDAPIVTPVMPISLQPGAATTIAGSFSVQDPAGKSITAYQLYDTGSSALAGSFTIGGVTATAHSSAGALTISAADLAGASFAAGSGAGQDSIMVRAFNGSYWGDWQGIAVLVGVGAQAPVLHVTTDQAVVRNGVQISLASLVSATSSSPVASYIIHDPALGSWGSGHVLLNGAVNLLGTASDPTKDMTYQVSAADFAKLTYVGGGFAQNGEELTITAVNQAQQASAAVELPILSVGLGANGISHFLTPGTTIPVSQMFALTGVDANFPIKDYIFALDSALTDKINLNGAVNLISAASVIDSTGWAHYEIAAADLNKVTYTAGTASGQFGNELIVSAVDSALSVTNAFPKENAATAAVQVTALPTTVLIGNSVGLTSLMSLARPAAGMNFHVFDPQGGGLLTLNGATNLLGKDANTGEYLIAGSDIGKVTYTGGIGSEKLLVATSIDNGASWAPEVAMTVTGLADAQTAAGLKSQATLSGTDPLFDASFYLAHNSDVAQANIDPLMHYTLFGWKEGRDPSAFFSTKGYLTANPDVKLAGIDPLQHYLDYGLAEGRPLNA